MSRKWHAGAVLFATVVLGAFVWMRVSVEAQLRNAAPVAEDERVSQTAVAPASSGASEAKRGVAAEGAEGGVKAGEAAAEDSPYRFETWQDARDHWAGMLAAEFDRLQKADPHGHPLDHTFAASRYVHSYLWREKKDPALYEAIKGFLPLKGHPDGTQPHRMPRSVQDPVKMLIHAGRLPSDILNYRTTVVGGRVISHPRHERLIVTYRVKAPLTDEGRAQVARFEAEVLDLEKRTASAPQDVSLQEQLRASRASLEDLKKPVYVEYTSSFGPRSKDYPGYTERRIDLGVIDSADLGGSGGGRLSRRNIPSATADGFRILIPAEGLSGFPKKTWV